MSITFRNAPVVEIIAELRWGEPKLIIGGQDLDTLFIRFGAEATKQGFTIFERALPPGAPIGPFQAVYRYRSESSQGRLLQLGNGVFTANATPPYQSWEAFAPEVRVGVEHLIAVLKDQKPGVVDFDAQKGFSHGILRYVNAFKADMTQGKKPLAFLADVLGINLTLPKALQSACLDGDSIEPVIQLTAATELGQIAISIGSGVVNNESALIYDISVVMLKPIEADADKVIERFTEARKVIHNLFVELTRPIHDVLQPEGSD